MLSMCIYVLYSHSVMLSMCIYIFYTHSVCEVCVFRHCVHSLCLGIECQWGQNFLSTCRPAPRPIWTCVYPRLKVVWLPTLFWCQGL